MDRAKYCSPLSVDDPLDCKFILILQPLIHMGVLAGLRRHSHIGKRPKLRLGCLVSYQDVLSKRM